MSSSLPARSEFVGYKCTNEDCARIFDTVTSFNRHKFHRAQKGTMCAHPKCGALAYQVPVAGSGLQNTRIVLEKMFSGECFNRAKTLRKHA
jgi:hypothetical protein